MRIFYAIELSNEDKDYLKTLQAQVKKLGIKGNYSDFNNFHITLAFIGEVDTDNINKYLEVLHQLKSIEKQFTLKTSPFDVFKKKNKYVLWVGTEPSPVVDAIYSELIIQLNEIGFVMEDKPFIPHITLGRNMRLDISDLEQIDFENRDLPIKKISLMESKRVDGKLVYEAIESIELT